jgi:hypothetical protein
VVSVLGGREARGFFINIATTPCMEDLGMMQKFFLDLITKMHRQDSSALTKMVKFGQIGPKCTWDASCGTTFPHFVSCGSEMLPPC